MLDAQKRKDNLEYVKQCIEEYASLGIKTINLFTGPVPWERNPLVVGRGIKEGEAWRMVLEAFEKLVPLGEKTSSTWQWKMCGAWCATISIRPSI